MGQSSINGIEARVILEKSDGAAVDFPGDVTADNDVTQTDADGAVWVPLASHPSKQVTIINTSGAAISVRYGSGTAISLPNGSGYTFRGITNSSDLQIKRTDGSNTQVYVLWNYENW